MNMQVASGELDGSSTGDNGMFSHSTYPGLEDEIAFRGGVEGQARYSGLDATSSKESLPVRDCVRSRLWLCLLDDVDDEPVLVSARDDNESPEAMLAEVNADFHSVCRSFWNQIAVPYIQV